MERIKKFFKTNIFYILFCLFLAFINFYLLRKTGFEKGVDRNTKYIIFGITLLIEIIFIFIINKFKLTIEKMFLIIAIPIGLMYLVLLPVGQIPDENGHYMRSYAISEGYIISDVDENGQGYEYMPKYILYNFYWGNQVEKSYDKITSNLTTTYDTKETRKYIYSNTSLYNFIIYIPQTVGVLVGKLFNVPPLLTVYLARLFNFITYIILIYLSLKLIPFIKKIVMLIALLPISLQEGVSLAPDALTISLSLLVISYILYLKYSYDGKIKTKQFVILTILSTICSLCKIVYMPIILMCLLLPKDKFKSRKDKIIKVCLLIGICAIVNGAWTLFATRYLVESNPGVNSKEQLMYILKHPFDYTMVMLRTYKKNIDGYFYESFGMSLGLLNIYTYKIYGILSALLVVVLSVFNSFKNFLQDKKDKIIYILVPIVIVLLISTSLYIQWTPLKNNVINGIQGRYFIPIIIFVPLIFMRFKNKKGISIEKNLNRYYYSFIVFQLINAATMIVLFNI